MSPERAVFIDVLLDLGFERVGDGFKVGAYEGFDRIFGENGFGVSTIEVKFFADHVNLRWITSWMQPPEGYPLFVYPFPEQWVVTMERLRQLIRLAEHKERTGETLVVEALPGRGR